MERWGTGPHVDEGGEPLSVQWFQLIDVLRY